MVCRGWWFGFVGRLETGPGEQCRLTDSFPVNGQTWTANSNTVGSDLQIWGNRNLVRIDVEFLNLLVLLFVDPVLFIAPVAQHSPLTIG